MAECPYYKKDIVSIPNKEKWPTIDQLPPYQFLRNWCEHPSSPLRKKEKGELKCNGEIGKDSKCPLSVNQ